MMHLTFAEKALLVGDEAAQLAIEYAAALARAGSADTVTLTAYGADGDKVQATVLLTQGAPFMGETSNSDMAEPDNTEAVAYMKDRLAALDSPPAAVPLKPDDEAIAELEKHYDGQ
jgi:hypothetical protein